MEMSDQRTPEEAHLGVALGYTRANVISDKKVLTCLMPQLRWCLWDEDSPHVKALYELDE
jgi:hypothetical protein